MVVVDYGKVLLAASILRGAKGEILSPVDWSTLDLGMGCTPRRTPTRPTQSHDLQSGKPMTDPGRIALLVEKTVLPTIWEAWGGDSDVSLVLLYPRTVEAFDPQTAEYVVFIEGSTAGN